LLTISKGVDCRIPANKISESGYEGITPGSESRNNSFCADSGTYALVPEL
jgi:hypothetical protein